MSNEGIREFVLVYAVMIILACMVWSGCASVSFDYKAPTDMVAQMAKYNAENNRDASFTVLRLRAALDILPPLSPDAPGLIKPEAEALLIRYSAKKNTDM